MNRRFTAEAVGTIASNVQDSEKRFYIRDSTLNSVNPNKLQEPLYSQEEAEYLAWILNNNHARKGKNG